VNLSQCTIALTRQQGDATRLQTVQVTLVNDTNANGTVDAGEAIVATRQVQGPVDTLTLDISPPFALLPNTVTNLLVTLTINSTRTTASVAPAAGQPGLRLASSWPAWAVALLALGSIGMLGRRAPSQCLSWILIGLVGGGCLVLMSCNSSDHDNATASALEFTVSMPVAGLSATGAMSGPLTQPVATIQGATLAIAP
jgi:hypothetical protein